MNFVIDRSWRTWKTNQITPTYLRSHSQGQYVVPLKGNSYHLRSQSIRVGIERVELQDRWEEELELQPKGFAIWHHGDTIKCMLRDETILGFIQCRMTHIQWSKIFLGITSLDPTVCKFNRLHVDILRFSFIKLGYILYTPLKWWVIFLQSWTSTGYFSNSTGSSVTSCRLSPIIAHISYFSLLLLYFLSSACTESCFVHKWFCEENFLWSFWVQEMS